MDKNKSLRYLLDKERFKGRKLPPKIQTNEDHISPDQRGDHTSADKHLIEVARLKENLKKPIEEMEFSRRGIFGGLTKLKEYAEESDEKAKEIKNLKKKQRRIKINLKPDEEEETEEGESLETATETTAETETTVEEPAPETGEEKKEEEKPKKNVFRRSYEYFFPPLKGPEDAPRKTDSGATDAVEVDEADTDTPSEEVEREMDRRQMIREGIHFFAKPTVENIQGKIDKVNETVDKFTKRVPLLRPPGAISERAFLQACTRCDKCMHACPKDAIQRVPKKMGFLIMDTPYIDPKKVPCVMCDELPCISACPEGALLPVPGGPADVEMGYAILNKKNCQAYGHTFCQQCLIDCPIPGAITQNREQRPIFHKDVCTGCGVCVRSCSTVNIPVAIKIKPQMVIEWQARKKAMEEKEKELEAERRAQALAEAQQAAVAAETTEESPDNAEKESPSDND